MTSHELARKLLDGPDVLVVLCVSDEMGLTSPVDDSGLVYGYPWKEDDDYGRIWEDEEIDGPKPDNAVPVILILPENHG